ncbi:MAG: glycosyltransferase [Bacteroidota bacterium]
MTISWLLITGGILLLYIGLISAFLIGWNRLKYIHVQKHTLKSTYSFIIPVRNEQNNILQLLHSIIQQDYPPDHFEIIVIDDHSEDNTVQAVKKFKNKHFQYRIQIIRLDDNHYAKKQAQQLGISKARHEFLIFSDADCYINPYYLKTVNEYIRRLQPKILLGPVAIKQNKDLLSKFQSLEFSSLIFSAAGALGISQPILANGANMIVDKLVFQDHPEQDIFMEKYASGDDMFLLEFIRQTYGTNYISFMNHSHGIVTTNAQHSISDFFKQRKRWVSKSKAYKNPFLVFTAVVVLLTAIFQILTIFFAFYSETGLWMMAGFWTGKAIVDFMALQTINQFLRTGINSLLFVVSSLIYPFYVVTTSFLGLTTRYEWKKRIYSLRP